jgi:hypothetical protein
MIEPSSSQGQVSTAQRVGREIAMSVVVGGVAPYVVYMLMHHRLGEVPSLILGGLLPGTLEIVSLARHRRLDPLSTLNLTALAVSVLLVMTGGGTHVVLMKESFITGTIGAGFLVTLLVGRPAIFYLGRQFTTGNVPARAARYDAAWFAVPQMRTSVRTVTLVWGVVLLGECAIRVALVFRLSTERMLVVGPAIFYAITLSLVAWTIFFVRRTRPGIQEAMKLVS